MLEKTWESPGQQGDQTSQFQGKSTLNAEAEPPIFWTPDGKSWLIGKDPDAGKDWRQEKSAAEDEMVGSHHWFNGHEPGWTPGDGEGQGGLAYHSPWGHKEQDTTWWLSNNKRLPEAPQLYFRTLYTKFSTKEPSSYKLSKMLTCISSMFSMSEVAADPPSPIAEYPSALPSPTSLPSWLCLPVCSTPAPVCQLLSWTTVLFKVLYYNMLSLFLCLFFLMYYLHE